MRRPAVADETEYAFDIQLYAVARVMAKTEAEARSKMHDVIDCIDIGYSEKGVTLTEASQAQDIEPLLFEVDGQAPPFPSEAHYIAAAKNDGWLPHDSDTAKQYCESNGIDASQADPKNAR
jgi:hypothetical protein